MGEGRGPFFLFFFEKQIVRSTRRKLIIIVVPTAGCMAEGPRGKGGVSEEARGKLGMAGLSGFPRA